MKIILENVIFLLVSHIFSASKQILYQKIHLHPHTNTHRKSTRTHKNSPLSTQNPPPHNTKTTKTPPPTPPPPQQQKKSEIKERKIERLREREIGQCRWRRSVLGGSRTRWELNLYSSMHGWQSENESGGSWVVMTRTRCGRGGSWLVIGEVGLGCLWIGDEGGVESIFAWVDWVL